MTRTTAAGTPALWLLRGHVTHERLQPVRHAFTYPMFQIASDLDHGQATRRWWFAWDKRRPISLRSADYGSHDGSALLPWMRAQLAIAGLPADGPIWLQTVPRMAGYAFNPVSFWYCHDRDGHLRALYADVRNTFGQHHGYLLCAADREPIRDDTRLICQKAFHVSPFCDVEGQYEFHVRRKATWWSVAIDYRVGDELRLRTAVTMRAEPFTGRRVLGAVLAQPFNALNIVIRIHWQALRLWCKGVPFYGKTPPSLYAASSGHTPPSDRETSS